MFTNLFEVINVIAVVTLLFFSILTIAKARFNQRYYQFMINALWTAAENYGVKNIVVSKSDIREHSKTLNVEIGRRVVIFSNNQ